MATFDQDAFNCVMAASWHFWRWNSRCVTAHADWHDACWNSRPMTMVQRSAQMLGEDCDE
jgi:hypothetical protein